MPTVHATNPTPLADSAASLARGLRAWLEVTDAFLRAIEKIAWDTRKAATRFVTDLRDEQTRLDAAYRAEQTRLVTSGTRIGRLLRTGWMLSRITASYRLYLTRAAFMPKRSAARALDRLHHKNAAIFRRTSEEEGGAFLKVGQMLSARADLLPESWIRELSVLQDSAPPAPFDAIRALIESELGDTLESTFATFDAEPIAAASIGQVHRAVTHDGRELAVKAQRPDIDALIDADLDLLALFLDGLRDALPPTDLESIVREIRTVVRGELDYGAERRAMDAMREFFVGVDGVEVPKSSPGLCTTRVLSADLVRARKLTVVLDELVARREEGDEDAAGAISDILGRLLEVYVRQILEAGAFQADPHPGNFLVKDDGTLVLLDFGATRHLSGKTRRAYVELVQAVLVRDDARVAASLHRIGLRTKSGDPMSLVVFADAVMQVFRDAMGKSGPIAWPTPEEALAQAQTIMNAAQRDPVVTLPGEIVMILRVFATLGGLFTHYRPEIEMTSRLLPTVFGALANGSDSSPPKSA